jgi:FdhE protein
MSNVGAPRHDAVPIGDIAAPPFAKLPDPAVLFDVRATRLRALADGHELAGYLKFLAGICDCQHRLQDGLADPEMPEAEILKRAREHSMPPLDRAAFNPDKAFGSTLDRLFSLAGAIEMPEPARAALDRAKSADENARLAMIHNVLADSIPVEAMADHVYVAAALQVHFARLASRLDAKSLVPVGEGVCPCCGGAPMVSVIVGWHGATGTRFCVCSLCATDWHVVRIKCTVCGSTEGISYKEVEGGDGNVKAETCDKCRSYVKILQQQKEPALDPLADDVASLALDLLVRDGDYRRGAVNPFLLGY